MVEPMPTTPPSPYTTLFRSAFSQRDIFNEYEWRELGARYAALLEECRHSVLLAPSDRKSTRLNSSHVANSYAVFCLENKSYGDGAVNFVWTGAADESRLFGLGACGTSCPTGPSYLEFR